MRLIRSAFVMLLVLAGSATIAADLSYQPQTDLPGFDYFNFDMPQPRPRLCQEACRADGKCKAWSFVQPGVLGPVASCWLKSDVAESKSNPCCISGVR
jgi:hypothetical protein